MQHDRGHGGKKSEYNCGRLSYSKKQFPCPIILGKVSSRQLRWEFIRENKKVRKKENTKARTRPRKWSRKKGKFFSWSLSCSSSCFLGRVLVFMLFYFLVFFFKFPPLMAEKVSTEFGRNHLLGRKCQTNVLVMRCVPCNNKARLKELEKDVKMDGVRSSYRNVLAYRNKS